MSNGTVTMRGYRPEVRTSYHTPSVVSGQIVDCEWRPIEYERGKAPVGVPQGYSDQKLSDHGLLGHAQAEAMRWWFIAAAEAERATGSLCMETRLQEYKLTITHTTVAVGAKSAINCRGDALPSVLDRAKMESDQ